MSRSEQATELSSNPASHAGTLTVCAIIVTWQPELMSLQNLLVSLSAQQCPVFVIDNGSANVAALQQLLDVLATEHPGQPAAHLVHWPENKGLATALNEGLRLAKNSNADMALLFDQDSTIKPGFVSAMLAQWHDLQALQGSGQYHLPAAAIGPRLQDPDSGRRTPFRCFRWRKRSDCPVAGFPGLYQTDFLISSGTLISLQALAAIGDMKDEYFIDNIDLEWCFRARARGYALYGTDRAVLFHRIGEPSTNPLVRSGVMVQHSPLRSYYSTRNRLHLRRQSYAPFDWKVRDSVRFALKSFWLTHFTAKRAEYRQQIQRGIEDAETMP
ncbi:glycosyltransferase family 2 protein [Gammaproteobacteria bacterium LSUCC0112]|nr:glycosyltransferase family 2 protein [Gammaproteobacteria bacterium LSUCC0112]